MLDLVAVAGQLRRMHADLASLAREGEPRLEQALRTWDEAESLGPELRQRIAAARTSWLVADPLEPLGAYPVREASGYRVVATDGSQVFPDRHELPQCFLVNVGIVEIDYAGPKAHLESRPHLAYLPADMYPTVGGDRQEADTRVVGARRFEAECDALAEVAMHPGGGRTVLLMDGTLVLWWLEPDPRRIRDLDGSDVKRQTFDALERLLRAARESGALVAGYLSAPRSTDVVSMLKVVLCTEDPVDCDHCPYQAGRRSWSPLRPMAAGMLPEPSMPCEEADGVADAEVFWRLLSAGQRSTRFRSAARITEAYEAPVDFVYLHTGHEIARVELPAWIDQQGLDALCAMLLDQCGKGLGYPVALSEAHEQAVVRAADRRAFIDLVRRGEGAGPMSAKLQRKRVSVV